MIGSLLVATAALAATSAEECAVLAVVAREHLHFETRASPPLRASGDYLPSCPWQELGVSIGTRPANPQAKLVLRRPRISGRTAIVSSLVIYGKLAGFGSECRLEKADTKWTLVSCRRTVAI